MMKKSQMMRVEKPQDDSLILIQKMGELVKANNLILHLLPIDSFIEDVVNELEEMVTSDPWKYVKESGVHIDDDTIDVGIESVWRREHKEHEIPTMVYEAVHGKIDKSRLYGIEVQADINLRENEEYQKNPLAYHGLKRSDFL